LEENKLSTCIQNEKNRGKDEARSKNGPHHQVPSHEANRDATTERFQQLKEAIHFPQIQSTRQMGRCRNGNQAHNLPTERI
jgi:hypothetical protein